MPQKSFNPSSFVPDDFQPTSFIPDEPAKVSAESKASGGKWVKKGLTTQWEADKPVDINYRPDARLSNAPEVLFDKLREIGVNKVAMNPYLPESWKPNIAMVTSLTLEPIRALVEGLNEPEGILGVPSIARSIRSGRGVPTPTDISDLGNIKNVTPRQKLLTGEVPGPIEPEIVPPIKTAGAGRPKVAYEKGTYTDKVTGEDLTGQFVPEESVVLKRPVVPEQKFTTADEVIREKNATVEVLPAEEKLDEWGIPTNRDMTPEEVERIKRNIISREREFYGEDSASFDEAVDKSEGIIDTTSVEADTIYDQTKNALDQGFAVYPPTYQGKRSGKAVGKLSDGSFVVDQLAKGLEYTPLSSYDKGGNKIKQLSAPVSVMPRFPGETRKSRLGRTKPDIEQPKFAEAKDPELLSGNASQDWTSGTVTPSTGNSRVDRFNANMSNTKDIIQSINRDIESGLLPESLLDDMDAWHAELNRRKEMSRGGGPNQLKPALVGESRIKSSYTPEELTNLWDQMTPLARGKRDIHIYDAGGKFTATERQFLEKNPMNNALGVILDTVVDDMLKASGHPDWMDHIDRTVLVFDPKLHGVYIPNGKGKGAIGINIPSLIQKYPNPRDAARWVNGLILHEGSHIGIDKIEDPRIITMDQNDPRVPPMLQTYYQQYVDFGGLPNHKVPFFNRLADAYEAFGPELFTGYTDEITNVISHKFGGYRPEVQRILQLYKEAQGRTGTRKDILARAGIGAKVRGSRKGNIPDDATGTGGGIVGTGNSEGTIPPKPPSKPPKGNDLEPPNDGRDKDFNWLAELWNLPRAMMSTDLPYITSAALRQGLRHIGTGPWFKAWYASTKSYGSRPTFEALDKVMRDGPLFQERVVNPQRVVNGKIKDAEKSSLIDDMGIRLIDLDGILTSPDEQIRSTWAERIPLLKYPVKASNRGFASYINHLRVGAAENMYNHLEAIGENPSRNLPLLKKIGDWVNNTTGAGKMNIGIPFTGGKEIPLDKFSEPLAYTFFAPRMIATGFQSFNPYNYFGMPKGMRLAYWKTSARLAAAWMTSAILAKEMLGASVELDMDSADFGKIRIGNTRLDPAGGLQQFLVLAHRLGSGKVKSTTRDRTSKFGKGGPYDPTPGSIIGNFFMNKLHPSAAFLKEFATATKKQPMLIGDKILQSSIGMVYQDLMELSVEDEYYKLLYAPLISAGWGSQTYDRDSFKEGKFFNKKNDPIGAYEGTGLFQEK